MGRVKIVEPYCCDISENVTDFDIASFTDLINRRGYSLSLYRTISCPCRTKESRFPEYVCPLCENLGTQNIGQGDIKGLIATPSQRIEWQSHGIWEFGEAQLTIANTVDIDYGDSVIYKKYTNRKNEIIEFNGNSKQRLRFNHVSELLSVAFMQPERYNEIKEIDERINSGRGNATLRKRREIIKNRLVIHLKIGTDVKLVKIGNRSFIHLIRTMPVDEQILTVQYRHNPEFVVMDLPDDDVDNDVVIVGHRKIKRRDLISGQDSDLPPYDAEMIT